MLLLSPMGAAQESGACTSPGQNMQCNAFGTITMAGQHDLRGAPVQISTAILLHTLFPEANTRWVLFSVRNVSQDGASPITLGQQSLATALGDVVVTRVEQPKPSELNLWVDVLDTPINATIYLNLTAGSSQRGAFVLEVLVMPFDRGYTPIADAYGNPHSLYSFTLLGVNQETGNVANGPKPGLLQGHKVPALEVPAILAITVAAGAWALRRRGWT